MFKQAQVLVLGGIRFHFFYCQKLDKTNGLGLRNNLWLISICRIGHLVAIKGHLVCSMLRQINVGTIVVVCWKDNPRTHRQRFSRSVLHSWTLFHNLWSPIWFIFKECTKEYKTILIINDMSATFKALQNLLLQNWKRNCLILSPFHIIQLQDLLCDQMKNGKIQWTDFASIGLWT